jgi:dihydrofolate reductase
MSRQCSGTMPGSGGQLRRSCIPGRFRRYPARGHRSSASSIETPSAAQAVLGADIAIGGAELAGHAIGAGLVDECHLFLCPIVVGGGKRALPDTSSRKSNFSMNAGSETASFTSTTA